MHCCLALRYLNGRFVQDDMVQHWSAKYSEVSNAMDMVGFEEQVRYLSQVPYHRNILTLKSHRICLVTLPGEDRTKYRSVATAQ